MSTAAVHHDDHLDRDVVIKKLQAGADQKRLLDEIRALSSVRSKHVVEIYDVIKDAGGNLRAIVEEHCSGNDLTSKAGNVSEEEFLHIAHAIAEGIADIHAHGVIHRDIKPNNMKFDAEGCLKIFDFGLARTAADAETVGLVGTFGYIAPELCVPKGQTAQFTEAVDVFAFASTLLRLISGTIPKPLKAIPPTLPCPGADFSKQNVAVPAEVAEILNRCHASNPQDRPTMSQVRDVIGARLLFDQHRALLVVNGVVHTLDAARRMVNIAAGTLGSFELRYNGVDFRITRVTGSIYINNFPVTPPTVLPKSCVITMGPPSAGSSRIYVPVDVSHPEVVQ